MNNEVLFSSAKEEWETPQDLFDKLDVEFHFTVDVAALPCNAKCKRFYTPETDGLKQDWTGEVVWCNPPYGKKAVDFVRKAYQSMDAKTVMLLPARTDTAWFHDYIYHNSCAQIIFIKGRLKFGGAANSAPFPSMIVIFNNMGFKPIDDAKVYQNNNAVTFERQKGTHKTFADVYKCNGCGLYLEIPIYAAKYNFCPYCGSGTEYTIKTGDANGKDT